MGRRLGRKVSRFPALRGAHLRCMFPLTNRNRKRSNACARVLKVEETSSEETDGIRGVDRPVGTFGCGREGADRLLRRQWRARYDSTEEYDGAGADSKSRGGGDENQT